MQYCTLFNAFPTKNGLSFGEMSQYQADLGNSTMAYYIDMTNRSSVWTATDIITYLLAGFAQPQLPPTFGLVGPIWTLSDPLDLLSYFPDKLDFDGKSLLECINNLINPRRGCTWRATYALDGSTPTITITVYSTSSVALQGGNTTSGVVTMPASTTTLDLDVTGLPFITDYTIDIDSSSQFDYIEVHGNRPLSALTMWMGYSPGAARIPLQPGWDTSLEPDFGGDWDPSLNQGPLYQNIWRRFYFNSTWPGTQWNEALDATNGLSNVLEWTTGASSSSDIASFGVGGYTGLRDYNLTDDTIASAQMLEPDKFIPLPFGVDYSDFVSAVYTLDMTQPKLAPMVFIYDVAADLYYDITDDYSVEVETNPPAIILSGDAARLASLMRDSSDDSNECQLLITIGIRENDPLVMSWQNADGGGTHYVSEVPRMLVRRIPYIEQWNVLAGTVLGCSDDGITPFVTLADLTTVDDSEKLASWLAYLKSWYSIPNVIVSWTDHSQIDTSEGDGSTQPGCLVATINRGDEDIDSGAVIATRGWDFTDANWGTSYTTERVIPDIDSIETHPRINRIWKSQAERQQGMGI